METGEPHREEAWARAARQIERSRSWRIGSFLVRVVRLLSFRRPAAPQGPAELAASIEEQLEPAPRVVPTILITGPYGVGKSTVLSHVSHRAASLDIRSAAIDVSRVTWVRPKADHERRHMRARNVAALWRTYEAAGATHLALADHDVPSQASLLEWLDEAVPGARCTIFRLRAKPETLMARVTDRDPDWVIAKGGPDLWREQWELFEQHAPEHHLIETEGREIGDIAAEIIQLSGWASGGPNRGSARDGAILRHED